MSFEDNIHKAIDEQAKLILSALGNPNQWERWDGSSRQMFDLLDLVNRHLAKFFSAQENNSDGYDGDDRHVAQVWPALPLMKRAADTYKERRGQYGPSEQVFGSIMAGMFPKGVTLTTREDFVRWGLFCQIVSKLARYSRDWNEPHLDSTHDAGVYSFMLEAEDRRLEKRGPFDV